MSSTPDSPAAQPTSHATTGTPSAWVLRFAALIAPGARVLDYACGGGRHARWLAARGAHVVAVDRDAAAVDGLRGVDGVAPRRLDLEAGDWALAGERFDAVVVTHYLHRPRLAELFELVRPGGVLIYETFMLGNERFGKPSNPEFLLHPGELLARLPAGWSAVAFEQGEVSSPRPAVIQRLCAVRAETAVCLPEHRPG